MMVMNQDLPLFPGLPVAGGVPALSLSHQRLRPRPAIGKCPRVGRIAQELMDTTLAR
jgi:hypothetical protein